MLFVMPPGGGHASRMALVLSWLGDGHDDDDDRDDRHDRGDQDGGRHRRAPGPRGVLVATLGKRPESSGIRARILLKLRHADDSSWAEGSRTSDSAQLPGRGFGSGHSGRGIQGSGASAPVPGSRSTSRDKTITLLV